VQFVLLHLYILI